MTVSADLIVVRIMPKKEDGSFDPREMFDKFCLRSEKYLFNELDVPTIKPICGIGDNDFKTTLIEDDEICHYATMLEQNDKGKVVRIGVARVRFVQASEGDPGSDYGIEPIEKPIVLEKGTKKSDEEDKDVVEGDGERGVEVIAYKAAFAHLENIISFSPNHPSEDGFVSVVEAPAIVDAIALLLADRTKVLAIQAAFDPMDNRDSFGESRSSFAQHGRYRHPLFEEDEADGLRLEDCRDGFQIDFDRVIHAKSYRRLVDKAQVYSSNKGDHYRTRMTHTQVVMQIARSIADALGADELLTSTIALAHDLGHTPFGHEGEGVLKEKLDELSKKTGFYFGGFKHNFQSMRVLALLDETHLGFVGSNVSWQVLEGVLWHTRVVEKAHDDDVSGALRCAFSQMDPLYFEHRDYFDKYVFHANDDSCVETECSHSWTVEGQIVAIADEVAQRSHDIDDAISAGLITVEELWKLLDHFSYKSFGEEIENIVNDIHCAQGEGRMFINSDDVLRSRVTSVIIRYLIQDICTESRSLLQGITLDDMHMVRKKVVSFSEPGCALNNYLETIIMSRVLASSDVTRSDARGARIVERLFEAYYANPKLLPESVLRRFVVLEKAMGCADVIDLSKASSQIAADEFAAIKEKGRMGKDESLLTIALEELGIKPSKSSQGYEEPEQVHESSGVNKELWRRFAKRSVGKMSELYDNPEELNKDDNSYLVKHVLLARVIADHIAGMTDSYATAEYRNILVV